MIFEIPRCPTCGELARGSIERLAGCAEFDWEEVPGQAVYSGYTDVWWDEQTMETNETGQAHLICSQGHEWYSDSDNAEDDEASAWPRQTYRFYV